MAKSNFIVRGGADFSGITQEMNKTEKQFKGFEGKINKAFSGIAGGMGLNIGKLGKFALIGAALKGLYNFGKQAVQVASDLEEVQNVVDVTFGRMSKQVDEFASNATKQFGLSELSAKKFASTMGAMLKSSGISGQAVTDMSIEITKLTADMASFYNLSGEEAFTKIRAGLSGETEPLKQLGINMSVANMEAYAMAQGINKAWREMTQAEQTMLRYNYLLSVTGDAQGDFARNSGSWANQIKLLKEQWQEFMGLIGQALTKILLPVVQGLNALLGILIDVTKEIGKIYTMITGKEVAVTANNNLSDSNTDMADAAIDAAEGQEKLGDGIGKAAKAAKKALAPFDELNILQNNLNDGGGSGGSGGGLGGLGNSTGQINTAITTKVVDEAPDKSKWEAFFIWFGDKWNRLKQMLAVPIMVPAPIFAAIPQPIYKPNWNLTPPLVPAPVFGPIPNPVYKPNWNLEYPQLQPLKIPALDLSGFNQSLEAMNRNFANSKVRLEGAQGQLSTNLETELGKNIKKMEEGLAKHWQVLEGNYNKHKANVGAIALGISAVLVANINQGLSKLGINTNTTITTTQKNWQTYGKNIGAIAAAISLALSGNISGALSVVNSNFNAFNSSSLSGLKAWGQGALSIAAEVGRGVVNNIVNGLSTAWDNFKAFAKATGEKVSGWFSANKKVIATTAIVGVAVGATALALAAPAAIPYAATALGGLATIPALAKGGITNGPTLAMVGDNPGGKEVVSPLDGLLSMIVEAVNTADSGSGGDLTVVVKVGEDTITEKVVSNINRQSRINGKTIIEV